MASIPDGLYRDTHENYKSRKNKYLVHFFNSCLPNQHTPPPPPPVSPLQTNWNSLPTSVFRSVEKGDSPRGGREKRSSRAAKVQIKSGTKQRTNVENASSLLKTVTEIVVVVVIVFLHTSVRKQFVRRSTVGRAASVDRGNNGITKFLWVMM